MSWKHRIMDPDEQQQPSASSWGCELKNIVLTRRLKAVKSASSWGCELKNMKIAICDDDNLSASSWGCELKSKFIDLIRHGCKCQPLREAVSWKLPIIIKEYWVSGQPLREAVSWKKLLSLDPSLCRQSASSWGCELKNLDQSCQITADYVSLFVRLWVENSVLVKTQL